MARYTGPNCKQCRREGCKLYLKGERCTNGKCAFDHRSAAPGQHGAQSKKMKEYGLQLRAKQTAKRYYGVAEKQFKHYYVEADRKEGQAGENLLVLLERRLDNVVYRMGMAASRKEARQLVRHGHFTLNGGKANIPSQLVKVGDEIAVKDTSKSLPKFKSLVENIDNKKNPQWLDVDKQNLVAKVVALPAREDVDFEIQENLIVELYSK